jgi:hypothetical protein
MKFFFYFLLKSYCWAREGAICFREISRPETNISLRIRLYSHRGQVAGTRDIPVPLAARDVCFRANLP